MRLVQSSTIINGAYADTALSWAAMRAVNWLPEAAEADGTRTPRKYATPPGLRLLVDLQTRAPVRGLEDVEGRLFAVSGDSLFEIANDLTVTNRGSIPGVGRVSMAHNQQGGASDANELAIANGLSGYVYNTDTTVLTQITDSAFEGATTFDYVDGYMSYTDPQGRWWGHSDLNQALQYSSIDRNDAESAPDKIVSHIVSHREVIVWGSRTGEFFRNTGAATGTFQRVDGTEMEVGICATFARARVDNTVCWVGNDLTVYRLNGHAPQRVSTRPIEQLLSSVDPTTIFCYTWEDRGHKVFYVTSPNNFTVGLDFASGLWHARESYGLDQWRINALVRWGTRWIAGDYVNGLLYELDWDWYTENGRPMVSQCATGYTWAEQNKLLCPYVELIFDTGGAGGVGYGEAETLALSGNVPGGYISDEVDTAYTATGGIQPYTFEILSGTFPPGLTLNANTGAVTGAFTTAGSYSWTVQVTDDEGNTDTLADAAEVLEVEWIADQVGPGFDVTPSTDGIDWTANGWAVTNFNGGFFVRRSSDGAVVVYNAIAANGYKFGISFNGGDTFSMYNTVGMNATGHIVGHSGTHWQCSSTSAATRVTDGGVQSQVASSTGFNTMCVASSRMIGFKTTRIWHADVNGDNWVDTLAMPITTLAAGSFRAKMGGSEIGMAGYLDQGATWRLHVLRSTDNGDSFTYTTPMTDIADPGSGTNCHIWHDSRLGLWAVVLINKVVFGASLASLTEAAYTFPSNVSDIGSDGIKFLFACNDSIISTSDFITFTEVSDVQTVSVVALGSAA